MNVLGSWVSRSCITVVAIGVMLSAGQVAKASVADIPTFRGSARLSTNFTRTPQVAADSANGTTAVWVEIGATHDIVFSDVKADGTWTAASPIPGSTNGEDPVIAMSPNGATVVAWVSGHHVYSSIRATPGGAFSGAHQLSPALANSSDDHYEVQVAINDSATAVAVWRFTDSVDSDNAVMGAFARGSTSFSGAQLVSGGSLNNQSFEPRVAIDSDGNSIMIFSHDNGGSTDYVKTARAAANAAFGAPETVESNALDANSVSNFPDIAASPSGQVIATWSGNCDPGDMDCTQISYLRGARGTTTGGLGSAVPLSNPHEVPDAMTGPSVYPSLSKVAIDAAGNGVVVWEASSVGLEAMMASWSTSAGFSPSGVFVNMAEGFPHEYEVSAADGHALFSFVDKRDGVSTTRVYAMMGKPSGVAAGGAWSSPQQVSPEGAESDLSTAALSSEGRATVAWREYDATSVGIGANTSTVAIPNGKQPIIFVHGVMGSKLSCGSDNVWPNVALPEYGEFHLRDDGVTNAPGSCSSNVKPDGLLLSVAIEDVYGTMDEHLRSYAAANGRRYSSFNWDWRKSPAIGADELAAFVDRERRLSGADKVMLVGHSMGGQVVQLYVKKPTEAQKVSRVVTMGTPYWGSAKSWLALAHGWTDWEGWLGLDVLSLDTDVHRFARNATGIYSLYPSDEYHKAYGNWLALGAGPITTPKLSQAKMEKAVDIYGGNKTLLRNAYAMHRNSLDSFTTNGVDYHAIVGGGMPTAIKITDRIVVPGVSYVDLELGDGDATVPYLSQTQGATTAKPDPLGDDINLHTVCGISHMELVTKSEPLGMMDDLLGGAGAVATTSKGLGSCPMETGLWSIEWDLDAIVTPFGVLTDLVRGIETVIAGSNRGVSSQASRAARIPAALIAAERAGRITILPSGPSKIRIVTLDNKPLTLKAPASRLSIAPLKVGKNRTYPTGAPRQFDPRSTGMSVSVTKKGIAVKAGGKVVKPRAQDKSAPRVRAVAKVRGKRATVLIKAQDRSAIDAVYLRIGTGKAILIKKGKVRIAAKQLKLARVYAVDVWGNASKPVKVRR